VLYAKLSRPKDSIPYLERAIAGGQTDILSLLGEMDLSLDLPEEAEKVFTRSIAEEGGVKGWFGRGRARHAQGRLGEALEDFDLAVKTAPEFAPALGFRGVVRLDLKQFPGAVQDLRRAIELDPQLRRAFSPFLDRAVEGSRKN
jgi:tetratricopeptide (TPR) repeat protein